MGDSAITMISRDSRKEIRSNFKAEPAAGSES